MSSDRSLVDMRAELNSKSSRNEAGKGDSPRPVDRRKWDACPLWKNKKK